MGRVQEIEVPNAVSCLGLLDQVEYDDAFRARTSARLTPEQWLRAVVQDAPAWFRWPWLGVGRAVLGAQVGPLWGSPHHVAGWTVLRDRDDLCAIGIDASRGLSARLVAVQEPGRVTIATQIELEHEVARRLWPGIRHGHRFFLPYLLGRAVERIEGTSSVPVVAVHPLRTLGRRSRTWASASRRP